MILFGPLFHKSQARKSEDRSTANEGAGEGLPPASTGGVEEIDAEVGSLKLSSTLTLSAGSRMGVAT